MVWGAIAGAVIGGIMNRKNSRTSSTTQNTSPWGPTQAPLQSILDQAQRNYQTNTPQYFPNSTVAGFDPWQQYASQGAYNYAIDPNMLRGITSAQQGVNGLMQGGSPVDPYAAYVDQAAGGAGRLIDGSFTRDGPSYDPSNAINTMMGATPDYARSGELIKAATDPMIKSFQNDILPSIRGQFSGGVNYSGSRRTGFERKAGEGLANSIGQVSAGITADERNRADNLRTQGVQLAGQQQGLNLQNRGQRMNEIATGSNMIANNALAGGQFRADNTFRGASLAPSMYNLGLQPWQTIAGLGDANQMQNQRQIEDDVARWFFEQNAPNDALQQYLDTVLPISGMGGTSTTTGANPNYQSPMQGAVGGAMTGYGLQQYFANNANNGGAR